MIYTIASKPRGNNFLCLAVAVALPATSIGTSSEFSTNAQRACYSTTAFRRSESVLVKNVKLSHDRRKRSKLASLAQKRRAAYTGDFTSQVSRAELAPLIDNAQAEVLRQIA